MQNKAAFDKQHATQVDQVVALLQRVYPKVRSYTDIHIALHPGSATERTTKLGGKLMNEACKTGKVKRTLHGLYTYNP